MRAGKCYMGTEKEKHHNFSSGVSLFCGYHKCFLYSDGERPVCFLNRRLKYNGLS